MYEVEFTVMFDGQPYDVTAWAEIMDGHEGTELDSFDFTAKAPDGVDVTTYANYTDELYEEIKERGSKELLENYHELP